jgi:prevent-host-death family protein
MRSPNAERLGPVLPKALTAVPSAVLLDCALLGPDCPRSAFSVFFGTRIRWSMTDMVRVTASEFQRSFGALSDKALTEPVSITKQGRDHLVLISATEYARLTRRERKVGLVGDLPEEWVRAVRGAGENGRSRTAGLRRARSSEGGTSRGTR